MVSRAIIIIIIIISAYLLLATSNCYSLYDLIHSIFWLQAVLNNHVAREGMHHKENVKTENMSVQVKNEPDVLCNILQ